MEEEFTGYATLRIIEYMNNNLSKDEIVRILHERHSIPVCLIMRAWNQIENGSPGFFAEYFTRTLLNDAETTDQGPTQIPPTSMGTPQNIGGDSGASSSLHVTTPTGDALIPVLQQPLSSGTSLTGTAHNVPIVTRAQVPPLSGDVLRPVPIVTRAQVPPLTGLTGTAGTVPRDTHASSSSQVPPETANAPVQHPPSSKTEILLKILDTLVEMKTKQEKMLKLMSDGETRKRTRDDEQGHGQQESPDSRRQRRD